MKQVNVKFLGFLVGSFLLFAVVLFGAHWLQSGRIAQALLWQAEHAQEQGKYRQAARYLSRYLEFVPKDLEKRVELGCLLARPDVAVSAKGVGQASLVLNQVLTEDPGRQDVRRTLAKLLTSARQLDAAREQLDLLQKAQPGSAEVAELEGDWCEAAGKHQEAVASWRAALKGRPDNPALLVRLARLLQRVGGAGQADPEIDAILAKAKELAPSDPEVVVASADRAQEAGDLKRARALLEEGLKAAPQDGRLHLSLATLEVRDGRRPRAIAMLRDALTQLPEKYHFELAWTLANLLIDDNQLDAARQTLAKLGKGDGVKDTVTYLEARCWMTQGRWHEAARALEGVRPAFAGMPQIATQIDLYLGTCHANLREPANQLVAFARAAQRSPTSVPARLGVVSALIALGKTDAALEEYRKLMALPDPPRDGWVEVARLVLENNLRGGRPDWGVVDDALNKAGKEKHDPEALALLRAEVLVARDQTPAARTLLAQRRQANPKSAALWTTDAVLANRQQGPRAALAILAQAARPENAGDSLELRLAQAEYVVALPAAEAKAALLQLEQRPGLPADKEAALWLGLAEAHARTREFAEADRLYRRVGQLPAYAQDVRLRLARFDVALRAGDEPGMLRTLDEIKALEGADGLNAAYGLAVHHVWKARTQPGQGTWLDDAAALLDRLEQKRPDWTAVMLARAEIEELRGNVDRALNHYRLALTRGERNPRAVRQYGQLLLKRKRNEEVIELARQYALAGNVSAELRRMAAFAAAKTGNLEYARVMTEPAAGADAKDFRDVLWRGQVLAAMGKYDDAEQALFRATVLAGDEPDPWVALARFFGARGLRARAEKVIQTALARLPADKRALSVAQCYDALNDAAKAGPYYQQALADRPNDVDVCRAAAGFYLRVQDAAKAEPCLRKLIDRKVHAAPPDVAWARHKLAVAIALRGDFRRYGEALDLVGLALDPNGNPVEKRPGGTPPAEEVAARARVLATQGRAPFRARAVALLEDLAKRDALLPEDRFLLAQLYESNGPEPVWWVKAGEQLAVLDQRLGDDAGYLAQTANWRIRHKEYREAQLQIDRLKKIEIDRKLPEGTLGSVELTVSLLEANRRLDEALTLLRTYAAKGPRENDPERIFFLVGAMQRRQRLADALDCCAQAWKTCPPEPCGGASLTTLRSGKPTPAQYGRVEQWLRDALKNKPDSPVLALQLADLYDMQGRLDQAETLYRDVLKRDKDNPVALNNLAWHLAQHQGRGADALPFINRAIEILGPQVELLDTRAVAYRSMGRNDLAVADLERVARDDPTASRHFRLAQAHYLAKDSPSALRALERSLRDGLDPARLRPADRESFEKMRAELHPR